MAPLTSMWAILISMVDKMSAADGPVRPRLPHWWGWIAPLLSSAAVTVGSIGVGAAAPQDPETSPDRNFYLLLWGLIGLAGLALLAWSQIVNLAVHRRRVVEVMNFNDHLSGVHQALRHLVQSDKGVEARREFFRSVVRQGTALLPMDGVRVCVYELDAREEEKNADAIQYLKLVDFSGRADPPRPAFEPDSDFGKAAIDAAVGQRQVTVSRREKAGVPINYNSGTVWRSYFTVPLVDGDNASRGMLTVDTRDVNVFSTVDVTVARTLASLIVIGMDELYGAAKDIAPEVSDVLAKLAALTQKEVEVTNDHSA